MTGSPARALLLLATLLTAVAGGRVPPEDRDSAALALSIAAVVVAGVLLGTGGLTARIPDLILRVTAGVLIAALLTLGALVMLTKANLPPTLGVAAAVLLPPLVVLSARAGTAGWAATLGLLALVTTVYAVDLARTPLIIDVEVFQRLGVRELLEGRNPWSMTFPNPYADRPDHGQTFYGPGVATDERLLFGFPYPAPLLLAVVPGALLGDVRLSHLAALVVTVLLLRAGAGDALGRVVALAPVLLPSTLLVLDLAWVEPIMVALLAATVVGALRGWRATPYVLGVLLVAKQYMVVVAPLVWLLPRMASRPMLVRVLGAGALATLPFLLWDPAGFWHSVVSLQFKQPYRSDSTSLLVWATETFGPLPSAFLGVVPLAIALASALGLALRAPRTPAAAAAATGLVILVLVLLSKQAFPNYYFLVTAAFLTAAVTWPMPTTAPAPTPARAAPRHARR